MMTREEALAIYHAGPEAVVRVLLEMDARIHALEQRLEASEQRVKKLEDQLAKNSRNSSKPPSTDGFTKPEPKSQRKNSGRASGGQPGHRGHTLQMVEKPDHIQRHPVERCTHCGSGLADQPPESIERRQVHDLPPMRLVVTEHQAEVKTCSCGQTNKAAFPDGVNAPATYGPQLKAVAVYLRQYQFLPYDRTCDLFENLFGFSLSEGTLDNIIRQCDEKLEGPVEHNIKELIIQAMAVHFDETGSRVDKERWWLHSASTENATYYDIHPKRGSKAMEAINILPEFSGRAIHDFWQPYLTYECDHGLCNAHHLRELTFVHEQHQQEWAGQMKDCLRDIKKAVAHAARTTDHLSKRRIKHFEDRYQSILDDGDAANPLPTLPDTAPKKRGRTRKTKARNLLERLDHHRDKVLAFMHDFNVPFDNNLAERDIRMMKVQQKISGPFRSERGAKAFCRIRSYISTARKNALGALEALARVFLDDPFVPGSTSTTSQLSPRPP